MVRNSINLDDKSFEDFVDLAEKIFQIRNIYNDFCTVKEYGDKTNRSFTNWNYEQNDFTGDMKSLVIKFVMEEKKEETKKEDDYI